MMVQSGLFNSGANGLGGETIKIAAYKVNLPFYVCTIFRNYGKLDSLFSSMVSFAEKV